MPLAALLRTLGVLGLTHFLPQFMQQGPPIHLSVKRVHAAAYRLIAASFLSVEKEGGWKLRLLTLLGIVVLGPVDEMTQPLVDRQAGVGDLTADVAGILAVTALREPGRLFHPGISR